MSLINQMLQDLEKRRASSSERSALPNQLRVLPPMHESRKKWWVILAGGTALSATALAWQYGIVESPTAPIPAAVPRVAAAASASPPAAATTSVVTAPAFRLALDLENVPAPDRTAKTAEDREVALKFARSVDKIPEPRPVRTLSANLQPPVSTAAVVAAASATEVPKSSGAATDAVTVMKAVPAAPSPAAPLPLVTAAKPDSIIRSALPTSAPPPVIKAAEDSKAQVASIIPQIDKRSQQLTAPQLSENEYRDASNLFSQGRLVEAQQGFRLALQHYPGHTGARQGLFGLLLDARKNGEAEQLLQDGLKINPNQPGFAMALARLQVDRGDTISAIETLHKAAPSALNSPDYLAFLAALLQRQSRHPEAVEHYQAALRMAPGSGVWLMGMGISLQAVNRNADAQDAFRRARASNTLNPELQAFVDQRLRQLQ